jgi:hypothetical protein
MLSIEPRRLGSAKKELRPIRVFASIGHAEHAGARMFQGKVFIVKRCTINGNATRAIVPVKKQTVVEVINKSTKKRFKAPELGTRLK